MKTLTATAIAVLATAALALPTTIPTFAQEAPPPAASAPNEPAPAPHHGPRGDFGGFMGFEGGAERVEIALVRLSHRLDLTEEQQTLFDTMRTDALSAAETFETAVADLRPQPPAEGEAREMPSMGERLENRIAFQTAYLDALEAVQPSATAFFDSLTDEQQAGLMLQRDDRMERGGHRPGGHERHSFR